MASIGNANIINDFKNAINVDDKKVFNSLSMDKKLEVISLKQKIKNDTSTYDDAEYELMMQYTNAVDEFESDSDESDSDEEGFTKKRKKGRGEGFTKKRKSYGVKKRKATKSKKQRKIKKKTKKTFRRF